MSLRGVVRAIRRSDSQTRGPLQLDRTWGVVIAIVSGSTHSVTVTIGGSTMNAPNIRYDASYTPTVGDVVRLETVKGDMVCLGKLA